jgi:hypothetical protein
MKTGLWLNIEDNYQLFVSARAPAGTSRQFVGGARFVPNTGPDQKWKITPGPYQHIFQPGNNHATVRIGLRFESAEVSTAEVKAWILDNNGDPYPDADGNNEYSVVLSGKKGDGLQRSTLILIRRL